jgi:2-polyprenyl-6-hydroxyphenyl methylase/3-demethylubiquinone-9 3-methyltransferase
MSYDDEIVRGERFAFGKNWQRFLQVLTEERIREAEKSLADFLGQQNLRGKTFLDIGSGSGLFSLAARRLGAEVCSFDFDHDSVSCTRELKRRYFPDDQQWQIRQGSILKRSYVESLGKFDICYSWGVLHHTGALYQALYNAQLPLKDKGILYVAIYNDQGFVSCLWSLIKKWYCSGVFMKIIFIPLFFTMFFLAGLIMDLLSLKNPSRRFTEHQKHHRGMSLIHDWLDWLGGYPYEPATKAAVESFYQNLRLGLINFKPPGIGFGNNEFLFKKVS